MAIEFKLQDPGEGIHEAEIREVLVSVGESVKEGQDVFVVETDKAAVEISSPHTGTVKDIRFQPGDVAHVGDVLMSFEEPESTTEAEQPQAASGRDGEARGARPDEEREESARPAEKEQGRAAPSGGDKRAGRVLATPATRRLARELDVDLARIEGTGPDGRVTDQDVRSFAKESESAPERGMTREGLPDFEQWGEVERVPLRSVRRATARRMARSWREIPHVTHQDSVDITELEAFRRRHESEANIEGRLTLTAIVLKALAGALKEHPRFNASLDNAADEVVLKHYCHLGVAVDTEQGLVVPVIRDADCKNLVELTVELERLSDRVREGKAGKDDLSGGTFTLTNIGALGGRSFTPIIKYPEVAILGLARARLEPMVEGDLESYEIIPRLMLPLCLAFDHRVIDGADAARFCNTIKQTLSDPERLALVA